jgi:hypothetical protein
MLQALNAYVRQLESLGRIEHFDSEGGGRITRVLYCEPYTAHKRVVTALKGTIYPRDAELWTRELPHADPLYPWFYCTDVQVEPAFPSAVRGAMSKGFNTQFKDAVLGQTPAIKEALDVLDDYDGASLLDNLTPAEIMAGGVSYPFSEETKILNTDEQIEQAPFTSRGRCGAKITATYSPLLFLPGITSGMNPFDYVDPQWEPLTVSTQSGRDLEVQSPSTQWPLVPGSVMKAGLQDSYALPELVWRFSIRRLMVPFIPAYTIALFANKINAGAVSIGTKLRFPNGTLRMETPEIVTRRAPDGQMMHDILLKFLVRRLYDVHWDVGSDDYEQNWIRWDEAYCRPANGWFDFGVGQSDASYYPVVWSADIFPALGVPHPLFADDNAGSPLAAITAAGGNQTGLNQGLTMAPFQAGMRANQ